jgi:hypothetical protein
MDISDPACLRPFHRWQDAVAALRAAEGLGAAHADVVRLSTEVIRTRNALTAARLRAGWDAPDDVLQRQTRDEYLLEESDDRALA